MTKITLKQALANMSVIASAVFIGLYVFLLFISVTGSFGLTSPLNMGCKTGNCGSGRQLEEEASWGGENVEDFLNLRAQNHVATSPLHAEMRVRRRINTLFPDLASLAEVTPLGDGSGLYQVTVSGEVFLMSQDGNYIVTSSYVDLSDVRTPEDRENIKTVQLVDYEDSAQAQGGTSTNQEPSDDGSAAGQSDSTSAWDFLINNSIHYPSAGDTRHQLIVFADMSCGACQAFHNQYERLTDQGVDIHVALLSTRGLSGQMVNTANAVMCSDNPKKYYEGIITGTDRTIPQANSCNNYAQNAYEAAMMLGIRNTPGLWLDGKRVTNMREVASLVGN